MFSFEDVEAVEDCESIEDVEADVSADVVRVPSISGKARRRVVNVVMTMQIVISMNGIVSCDAATLSSGTPANIMPVTKSGAMVVPNELTAHVKFILCTALVPGNG